MAIAGLGAGTLVIVRFVESLGAGGVLIQKTIVVIILGDFSATANTAGNPARGNNAHGMRMYIDIAQGF